MGQPKLLLPWTDGKVIDHVLKAWTRSRVDETFVVVRNDDEQLIQACQSWPVRIVTPAVDPPDMKASLLEGIRFIERSNTPQDCDRVMLAPADMPELSESLINQLIEQQADDDTVLVPSFGGETGHPIALPWRIACQASELSGEQGMDVVVRRHRKTLIPVASAPKPMDINTPDEYQQAIKKATTQSAGET